MILIAAIICPDCRDESLLLTEARNLSSPDRCEIALPSWALRRTCPRPMRGRYGLANRRRPGHWFARPDESSVADASLFLPCQKYAYRSLIPHLEFESFGSDFLPTVSRACRNIRSQSACTKRSLLP